MKKIGVLTTTVIVAFLFINAPICHSQTIIIDSTFNQDAIIYPFDGIDTITGLKISGSVDLQSDSSLIRVIFSDTTYDEFMVYESYPLITASINYSFTDECDETCFLNLLEPYCLRIEIIDATLTLDSIHVFTDTVENPELMQYSYKRLKDSLKIDRMNKNLSLIGMRWKAGDNLFVGEFYRYKKETFGEKYNLIGFDYYAGGIFDLPWATSRYYDQSDLIKSFDWRDRHGANDKNSPYYDNDTMGTGWLTKVKFQWHCGSCYAFATVGILEADINLYFNQHLDLDLSEQDIVCNYPGGQGCDGGNPATVLNYLTQDSILRTEYCYPYFSTDDEDTCTDLENNCIYPDTTVDINGYGVIDLEYTDTIRKWLIEKGPQVAVYQDGTPLKLHAVALTGYIVDPVDQSIIWIYKNSMGEGWGENGFGYSCLTFGIDHDIYFIFSPTYVRCDVPPERLCKDEDGDGYCVWGIGDKPKDCPCPGELQDCDDNDPLLGQYDSNYYCTCLLPYVSNPDTITSFVLWQDTLYVDRDIVIDSGGMLTVEGFVGFSPGAKVIVKPGGELLIDGGTLTKACLQKWNGVEVFGKPDTSQYCTDQQGIVRLHNNGSIQNALIGIFTGKKVNGDYVPGYEGGIIQAREALFLNNNTDVEFRPYHNIHPYSPDDTVNNISYFTKCTFETDYFECLDFGMPEAHMILDEVKGIRISGCSFFNGFPVSEIRFSGIPEKIAGIYATDASVLVLPVYEQYQPSPPPDPPCDTCYEVIPCTFENLRYGIRAFNSGGNKLFHVSEAIFNNTIAGIYLSGYNQPKITSNEFNPIENVNSESLGDTFWGDIYMEGCTGYHIEDNEFGGPYDPASISINADWCIGMYIKDSGPDDNEIYNNIFHNLHGGIVAEGVNRDEFTGLCLKCNDMVNNRNDFLVWESLGEGADPYVGIKYMQGADTNLTNALAGNTFTYFTSDAYDNGAEDKYYWNYLNYAMDFYYFHHQLSEEFLLAPPEDNYTDSTILLIEKELITFNKTTACPSGLGGNQLKSGSGSRFEMAIADERIDYYKGKLNELVDGGDTYDLNFDVMASLPDEALAIRQQLLNESPYLSDTVMKQTIYKEDVLPNAMVRDVLVANPQSAKSENVLESLEDRFDPLPGYMMAEIMQGREYLGAKEILESKLGYWQQYRSRVKNQLIREFLTDTTLFNPYDSLIALFLEEDDLQSKYRLAFSYLDKDMVTEAIDALDYIPITFELNNFQISIHQDYEDYFDILQMVNDSTWNAQQLDSVCINTLSDIVDNDYPLISDYARGLLVKGGHIDYTEQVVYPNNTKSYWVYQVNPQEKVIHKTDYLLLFPNPAGNYVIVYFNTIELETAGKLLMHDINGKILKTIVLKNYQNQLTLNLGDIPNGVYIISLYVNGKLIESEKLTKVGL